MKEFIYPEEIYSRRTLTNGNIEWFGVYTGQHAYKQKEVDFNIPKSDKSDFKE